MDEPSHRVLQGTHSSAQTHTSVLLFDRFENDMFSPEMLTDLLIEGCVIFRKLMPDAAQEQALEATGVS